MQNFIDQLTQGSKLVLSSLGTIGRARLNWVYVGIAGIALVLFVLSIVGSIVGSGMLYDQVTSLLPGGYFDMPTIAQGTLQVVFRIISSLGIFAVLAILGGCVILTLASPLLTKVAKRTWATCKDSDCADAIEVPLFRSTMRAIVVALRCLLLQIPAIFLCIIIGVVPGIGIVAPVLSLGACAYLYGLTFCDYAFEIAGFTTKQEFAFARKNAGLMVGIGLPFSILLMIPFVGPYVAMAISPASTAAGARALCQRNILAPK